MDWQRVYKYLETGTAKEGNRSVLTWAHRTEYRESSLFFASNAFRLHLAWDPPPALDGVARIPFRHSVACDGGKAPNIVPILDNVVDQPPVAVFQAAPLRAALKPHAQLSCVTLALRPGYARLLSLDLALDVSPHLVIQSERTLVFSVDPALLYEALDTDLDQVAVLPSKQEDGPLFVGRWGSQGAAVMPMYEPKQAEVLANWDFEEARSGN